MNPRIVAAILEKSGRHACIWPGVQERYAFRLTSGLAELGRVVLQSRYEVGCSYCIRLSLQDPQAEQDKDWTGGVTEHDIKGQMLLIGDLSGDKDAPGSDCDEGGFAEHEDGQQMECAGASVGRRYRYLVASLYRHMKVRAFNIAMYHYAEGAGGLLDILPASRPAALQALSMVLSFSEVDGIAADWSLVGDDIASAMRKEITKGMPKHDTEPDQP
jgi:hypothetical protein